jgi:CHASE3 domain sensor protein
MKINIEIDCSPEEARRFMGLPDVEKANEVYVDAFAKAMKTAGNTEQLQEYARQLAPMGQMGLKMFQNFMEGARKAGERASNEGDKPDA